MKRVSLTQYLVEQQRVLVVAEQFADPADIDDAERGDFPVARYRVDVVGRTFVREGGRRAFSKDPASLAFFQGRYEAQAARRARQAAARGTTNMRRSTTAIWRSPLMPCCRATAKRC